jgi:hypothetical protein
MFILLSATSTARRWTVVPTFRDYMLRLSSGSNLVDLVGSLHCDRQSRPTRNIHGIETYLDFSINCDNVKHVVFTLVLTLSQEAVPDVYRCMMQVHRKLVLTFS